MRVRAIVKGGGEIQLGLDIDFHALRLALALRRALARAFADLLFEIDFGGEWKAGLGIVGMQTAAASTVFHQPSADFAAPLGLWRRS